MTPHPIWLPPCWRRGRANTAPVSPLLLLAPFFLLFELGQLVLCERYVGIKQIERNADPRTLGLGERTALLWTGLIFAYLAWMVMLLFQPAGRVHGLCLLATTGIGYVLRRSCGLKWLLVVLTFEGAIRVGLLFSLCVYAWRHW